MPIFEALLLGLFLLGCSAPLPGEATPNPTITENAGTSTGTSTLLPSLTVTVNPPPTLTLTPAPTSTSSLTPTPTPPVLVGAGDISVCGLKGASQTAALLANIPGTIFTAGDNTNETGQLSEYTRCFDQTWGRFKDRIRPAPGNHDYMTAGAEGYYSYFGIAAGERGKGYYSYDLGGWHVIALNSNCNSVGCGPDSAQVAWLAADLEDHPARCTLAYWHHPRFSSGLSGNSGLWSFWDLLYKAGAEVVVNGNDHDYERFAPQDPNGKLDRENGIREFVAGTGGAGQRVFAETLPNSEARHSGEFGVLQFTLYPDRYAWEFIPVEGGSFRDSGMDFCH